jgi:RNA 3'-terminal phosphate cyclase (ATP)
LAVRDTANSVRPASDKDFDSRHTCTGGTHNPMAPPLQFLQRTYARALADMGATIDRQLERFGFYPAGGGVVTARVEPCAQLRPCAWMSRGARRAAYAESFVAGVPGRVAQRELDCVGQAMGWDETQLLHRGLPQDQGPAMCCC